MKNSDYEYINVRNKNFDLNIKISEYKYNHSNGAEKSRPAADNHPNRKNWNILYPEEFRTSGHVQLRSESVQVYENASYNH